MFPDNTVATEDCMEATEEDMSSVVTEWWTPSCCWGSLLVLHSPVMSCRSTVICPGLAALTWWLRLQVVSFIAGRRRRSLTRTDYLEDLTNTLLGAEKYQDVKVRTR